MYSYEDTLMFLLHVRKKSHCMSEPEKSQTLTERWDLTTSRRVHMITERKPCTFLCGFSTTTVRRKVISDEKRPFLEELT